MLKRFQPTLSKLIPILLLIILAFTYRDVVRSMVMVPLAYLILIFRLAALSIGQQTLWISFVVFSTIIAVISLVIRREAKPEESPTEHKYPTRLQTWINTVQYKERSPYFQWNLAQDLGNLVIEAIAYRQGTSAQLVRQQLETEKFDLPPEIHAYLQISQKPFTQTGLANHANKNWWLKIWATISRRVSSGVNESPLDLEHERILNYLENYLEIDA